MAYRTVATESVETKNLAVIAEQLHSARPRVSIFRHAWIDFVGPRADAAFDALDVLETLLTQKLQGLHRPHPGLAVDIVLLVGIEFGETARECVERNLRHAIDVRDLVFVR